MKAERKLEKRMIQKFVDSWMENRELAREKFSAAHPNSYEEIVRVVIETITVGLRVGLPDAKPDPTRIHSIDDGDYQGTLVFVVGAAGYQPWDYWYVRVIYGSCSGCDTLQEIKEAQRGGDKPTVEQVNDYMTLALHVVQGLREMRDDE